MRKRSLIQKVSHSTRFCGTEGVLNALSSALNTSCSLLHPLRTVPEGEHLNRRVDAHILTTSAQFARHVFCGTLQALYAELAAAPSAPLNHVHLVALCPSVVNTALLTSGEEASGGALKGSLARAGDAQSERTVAAFQVHADDGNLDHT